MLNKNDFYNVVKHTPLIAIDFLIINSKNNKALLGLRKNQPAKNEYFTFGSVMQKNETIEQLQKRVLKNELGLENVDLNQIKFNGIFEQNFNRNFKNSKTNTHYIVLSYVLKIDSKKNKIILDKQHSNVSWFSLKYILKNTKFNKFVKELILKYNENE